MKQLINEMEKAGLTPVEPSSFAAIAANYKETEKILSKAKIAFDKISAENLKNDCVESFDTIKGWFSRLTFEQIMSDEKIFAMREAWQSAVYMPAVTDHKMICDFVAWQTLTETELTDAQKSAYLSVLARQYDGQFKTVKKASAKRAGKPSQKALVDSYIESIGVGLHNLSTYLNWYEKNIEGSTPALEQLRMCVRHMPTLALSIRQNDDVFELSAKSA